MPEAEVYPGVLNVGYGGVINQGVMDSEDAYIGWGGLRETEDHTRKYPRIYYFFKYFSADKLVIKAAYRSIISS